MQRGCDSSDETPATSASRMAWAEQIARVANPTADEATAAFLRAHPDWLSRYGDRARDKGTEDARYHVTFLAAAVESGSPAAFVDYVRWTARVLESRSIARSCLVEHLVQVKDALSDRLAPEASRTAAHYICVAVDALRDAPSTDGTTEATDRLALPRAMYVQAALAGERTAALNVALEALRGGATLLDVYVDVLQAAQYDIGRSWERNQVTVAHEHAATAVTQFVTSHLYARLERTGPRRGTLIMTGVEGELHSVGALIVGDMLEAGGWAVYHVGTDVPCVAIMQAIRDRTPDWVGISATILTNIGSVRRLVGGIRQEWGHRTHIILGGSAFRHVPGLSADIGADAQATDVRDALALLCRDA